LARAPMARELVPRRTQKNRTGPYTQRTASSGQTWDASPDRFFDKPHFSGARVFSQLIDTKILSSTETKFRFSLLLSFLVKRKKEQ
jgi:hypothetical protein